MRRSLIGLLWNWYREQGLIAKFVYPMAFAAIYGVSVLFAVGAYWLKTDMNYNVFREGGWHSFARCLATEVKKNAHVAPPSSSHM